MSWEEVSRQMIACFWGGHSRAAEGSLVCEECEWASYRGKGASQQAVGDRCYSCACVHTQAYTGMAWQELVAMARTSQARADEIARAKAVFEKKKEKTFVPETVDDLQTYSMSVTKAMVFVSSTEFAEVYGVKPSSMEGLSIVEITDEHGCVVSGVLLEDPKTPFRSVSITRTSTMQIDKKVLNSNDQLRPNQGAD
eukprot:6480005-Amphidinium_carterae.1